MKFVVLKGVQEIGYPTGLYLHNFKVENFSEPIIKLCAKTTPVNLFCIGSSGSILSAIIAQYLYSVGYTSVRIRVVRKTEENHHDWYKSYTRDYEDEISEGFNVVVDDFIASGKTLINIMNKMQFRRKYNKNLNLLLVSGGIRNNKEMLKSDEEKLKNYLDHFDYITVQP